MTTAQPTGPTGGYYHLLKAVLYRDLVVWLRYPINALLEVFFGLFLFGMLFYGGTLIAGQAIGDSLEGLIVGYFLLALTNGAYQGLTGAVGSEASWGTLERHYLTPFGFGPVMVAKSMAITCRNFITSVVILAALMTMTGTSLEVPVLTVLCVATLTIASVLGVGFAIGGLGVLYKRIGALNTFLGFVFVGLIASPAFDLWWATFLPLAHGSALLQRAMTDGVRLWEFEPVALVLLLGTAVSYLAAGYLIFRLSTRRGRRLGTLGDY